ncbi:branched-chain amino acid ABC transporter substrate-binding protein [Caenimonas koreensis]
MVRIVAYPKTTQAVVPLPAYSPPPFDTAGKREVLIGHAGPLSGPQGHFGRDNENGVRLALEELNAQDLRIGGERIYFTIASLDDVADPMTAVAVARRFCAMGVAGIVGHLNSGTTIQASPVYASCGIPHITGSATNPRLTRPKFPTTFRIIADDDWLGVALGRYGAQILGIRTAAVVHDRTPYGQNVAEQFRLSARANGIQIVDEQVTSDKATDFEVILTAIKAKAPDAIFYGGMDPQAGPMLRQMQQLGLDKIKYFGGDGICTSQIAKLSGNVKTLDNVICAEGGALLNAMPGGAAWKEKYDARFPGQFQVYSPYTYDATFVLVEAMKKANSVDPKVYTAKLAETNYKGVTATIAFEANGELKNPATTLYTYKDGKKTPM